MFRKVIRNSPVNWNQCVCVCVCDLWVRPYYVLVFIRVCVCVCSVYLSVRVWVLRAFTRLCVCRCAAQVHTHTHTHTHAHSGTRNRTPNTETCGHAERLKSSARGLSIEIFTNSRIWCIYIHSHRPTVKTSSSGSFSANAFRLKYLGQTSSFFESFLHLSHIVSVQGVKIFRVSDFRAAEISADLVIRRELFFFAFRRKGPKWSRKTQTHTKSLKILCLGVNKR